MEYLEEDKKHWSKQRHTAKRIFERLRDEEGYLGSYDAVQKYVQKIRKETKTTGTQELVWELEAHKWISARQILMRIRTAYAGST